MSSGSVLAIPLELAKTIQQHEIATAQKLVTAGYDVEFLVPSNVEGIKTPDIRMGGIRWEMKSPTGAAKNTISNQLSRAARQCDRLVLDTSRTLLRDDAIVVEVCRRVAVSQKLFEVIVLRKTGQIVHIAPRRSNMTSNGDAVQTDSAAVSS